MSQHVPETCNESDGLWLPLIEYSVKTGVSLSTIRRKIKSNSIQFRLEKGRYLIYCGEARMAATPAAPALRVATTPSRPADEVRMVSEAYEHALKEKDERIQILEKRNRELEDRLGELRTLVRALEEKYAVRY